MSDEPGKKPVRIRTRITGTGDEPRLVASPAPSSRRKREPNSGSMKKGETRNPHGRPKGAKGTKAMVRKVLSQKMTIREKGASRKVTLFHALLLKEVEIAFAGGRQARKTVLELGRWALPEEAPGGAAEQAVTTDATDEAILAWFEGELRARDAKDVSE